MGAKVHSPQSGIHVGETQLWITLPLSLPRPEMKSEHVQVVNGALDIINLHTGLHRLKQADLFDAVFRKCEMTDILLSADIYILDDT